MDLQKIPKIELHYHLDGSVSAATLIDVAIHDEIVLPTYNSKELEKLLRADESCVSLANYLSKFDLPLKCMQTEYALEYISYKAIEDVSKQNVKYIEIRFAPQLHTIKGLDIYQVTNSVICGLQKGEKEYNVISRIIIVCLRSDDLAKNIEVLELTNRLLGNYVVGIDLAGDELKNPPNNFMDLFDQAKKLGIPITIHAGEAAGPDNVRKSIENLHATRIGHGISSREDSNLIDLIRKKSIYLELCITSNVQTKAVKSWKDHPVKEFYDCGIKITINTDNSAISNTNLSEEYSKLISLYGFTLSDLHAIILNGLDAAFISERMKNDLRAKINDEFMVFTL